MSSLAKSDCPFGMSISEPTGIYGHASQRLSRHFDPGNVFFYRIMFGSIVVKGFVYAVYFAEVLLNLFNGASLHPDREY